MPAIVEYCATGNRFKVYVPTQAIRMTFILGGIRVPRVSRSSNEESDPFGDESLNFANEVVLQVNLKK
jgi:staphylococcal nuclease domain-containing protein 1